MCAPSCRVPTSFTRWPSTSSRVRFQRRWQNLRPAQETCEQCHWPKKFHGAQLKVFTHYANDETKHATTDTNVDQDRRRRTGRGNTGGHSLAHEHRQRNQLRQPAIAEASHSVVHGDKSKYRKGNRLLSAKDADTHAEQVARPRRGAWIAWIVIIGPPIFTSRPDRAVDNALISGRIDSSLPFIKQQAVTALTSTTYKAEPEALSGISSSLSRSTTRENIRTSGKKSREQS